VSKVTIRVLVETEHGMVHGEWRELEYEYPRVLSDLVRHETARMGLLLEQRLEGFR
jgi:hypothetical protein